MQNSNLIKFMILRSSLTDAFDPADIELPFGSLHLCTYSSVAATDQLHSSVRKSVWAGMWSAA